MYCATPSLLSSVYYLLALSARAERPLPSNCTSGSVTDKDPGENRERETEGEAERERERVATSNDTTESLPRRGRSTKTLAFCLCTYYVCYVPRPSNRPNGKSGIFAIRPSTYENEMH